MIAKLKGILEAVSHSGAILDVNGVGYEVQLTESDIRRMPEAGAKLTLAIHTHVREDAFSLYGFVDTIDRDLFRFLMEANGVGPKLALGVLACLDGEKLLGALRRGDIALLASVPGIGKKKAERLILELQDKVMKRFGEHLGVTNAVKGAAAKTQAEPDWTADLLAALLGLGYREADVRAAAAQVIHGAARPATFELALKDALKVLGAGARKGMVANA